MIEDKQNTELSKDDKNLIEIYKDVCANIRVTDDISFKLLSIVPIASGIGSGALVLLDKSNLFEDFTEFAVIVFSLIGVLVTFALFKWELRNIQKCHWLLSRAYNMELKLFKDFPKGMQFQSEKIKCNSSKNFEDLEIKIFGRQKLNQWGKTESEKLIYLVAIFAWLVPLMMVLLKLLSC